MGCVVASDCDTKVGPLGCGEWACSEGRCVERIRCTDEDGDGDGSGPDCACSGKTTDCDDHDPLTGDMATASCCNGGTRTCKAGRWNVCSGATGETCDGEDNDCNGVVDDLGTFSCGLGACRNTVTACTGGALAACLPNPPLSASDGCNGIDDDCDGAVDEDCPECLHVAPDGDDGAAEESAGTLPFRTVQAALDYADAHRNGPNRVCVAAGAECGATAIYMAEPGTGFTMRDGISLLGNYESTTFTRCTNSTTRLRPGLDQSVVFPPGIRIQTVLDGFAIDRSYSANATGVSVTGASGAVLSNLAIVGAIDSLPIDSNVAYGVKLVDSSALIARSTIDGGRSRETYAVHATRSKVLIEENCSSPLDANGACTGDCTGSGPMLNATPAWHSNQFAVELADSPGSRVQSSTLCMQGTSDSYDQVGIRAHGAASGIVIRGNNIGGKADATRRNAVLLHECDGAAPWLVQNSAIGYFMSSFWWAEEANAVRASGDCHPVIESNPNIRNTGRSLDKNMTMQSSRFKGVGVTCTAGSVPSRCVISRNGIVGIDEIAGFPEVFPSDSGTGSGVICSDRSCARIQRNTITGLANQSSCTHCARNGSGVEISGGATEISDNRISDGGTRAGNGLSGISTASIHHNRISPTFSGAAPLFEANYLPGLCSPRLDFGGVVCATVFWLQSGGVVRNNCITGGALVIASGGGEVRRPAFRESNATTDPAVFENNGLVGPDWLYINENTTALSSVDAVNALTDMSVQGTTSNCPGTYGPRP